jgi:hypothetical protein
MGDSTAIPRDSNVTVLGDITSTSNEGPTHGPTPPYTGGSDPVIDHANIWSVRELNILGGFLWLAVFITLVGNLSCFYAVYKNLKKIMEHPFFQSNVFCVLLSVTDVLLVMLVGIPAAVFFSTASPSLGKSFYNL